MTYLYRDAGNYKHWQDVVFPNRTQKSATELTVEIRKHLISGEYFERGLAPIPIDLDEDFDDVVDHSWLEFHDFREVEDPAHVEQDISEFIANLAR